MGSADSEGNNITLDELKIIVDSDSHITESVEDLIPYIDSKFQGIKRIIENADYPHRKIYSLTNTLPIQNDFYGDGRNTKDASKKKQQMNDFNIDASIVGPTLNLGINTVENEQAAAALSNAYNSWLLDNVLDEHNSLKGTILAAPQTADKAAEEIDRLGSEKDIVGVQMPGTGMLPPAGHRKYSPIYQAAQDHGLPILSHGANTGMTHGFPTQRRWNQTFFENHLIAHPFTQIWNITTMMAHGIPERFPDLDFVFQEAGIGWIPYLIWRMDDHYLENSDEVPFLKKLPSKYVRDQFYFTTQPLGHTARNPKCLSWIIKMTGPASIMYSSDLPHMDFDPPEELFNRLVSHFDQETIQSIMGKTAKRVFGLSGI